MTSISRAVAALVCIVVPSLVASFVASCAGGGSGSDAPVTAPSAPTGLVAIEDDAAVTLAWTASEGAETYDLYWSTSAGVLPTTGTLVEDVASPFTQERLTNDTVYFFVVVARNAIGTSSPSNQASAMPSSGASSRFFPGWAGATPTQLLTIAYDPTNTSAQNGARLSGRIATLLPGQMLAVGAGTWTLPAGFEILLQGTADFPIWIVSASGGSATLTSASSSSPVVSLGGTGAGLETQYVCLRYFDITGGAMGIDVRKASYSWIDRCHIHHTGGAGVHATSANTHHLHVTRCDIHDTASWGEGLIFGDDNVPTRTHHSVIAQNHVHDTRNTLQGDGIELREGCYANWIVENRVHTTNYPCILFHGTNGQPVNVFERNVLWDALDNVMQAEQGEAIVRNNVICGPAGNKVFDSTHNEATLRDLTVVHNTFFSQQGYCVGLFAWDGQPNMVFANNAVYSNPVGTTGYAIAIGDGQSGGTLSNNVVVGYTPNVGPGVIAGTGLGDFEGVASWSQSFSGVASFRPSALSALLGAGNPAYAATVDALGTTRTAPYDAGAVERE